MIFYYHPNIIATHRVAIILLYIEQNVYGPLRGAGYYIVANLILDNQPNFTVDLYHLSLLDLL